MSLSRRDAGPGAGGIVGIIIAVALAIALFVALCYCRRPRHAPVKHKDIELEPRRQNEVLQLETESEQAVRRAVDSTTLDDPPPAYDNPHKVEAAR